MIAFRLDANAAVATGHMYRCISIAKKCRELGKECLFLLAENEYTEILQKENMPYYVLGIKWDDWNYGIEKINQCLEEFHVECLVVDSYRVTENFFDKLSDKVKIFYLDDLCKKVYKINAVLHYSEWDQEQILADLYKDTEVKVYSGMKYMPLRECFEKSLEIEEKKYKLMITTGGSDTYHITLELLKELAKDDIWVKEPICAVLGKLNVDREEIEELAKIYSNISIMQNISNMDEIMRQSECAVTAGGTSVYELMASGVPFVCFGFSEDQKYFGERLEEYGNAFWAGDAREGVESLIKKLLLSIKKIQTMNFEEKQDMIQKNRALLDGQGSKRIAEILVQLCNKTES